MVFKEFPQTRRRRGRPENTELKIHVLQIIERTSPHAFVSDIYKSVKEAFGYKSKGTLVKFLFKLWSDGYIKKQKWGVYRIEKKGLDYLKKMGVFGPVEDAFIRAYLVEEKLPAEELEKKMLCEFAGVLREMKYNELGEYRYEFGGYKNLYNKAICLVGHGPFKVRRAGEVIVGTPDPLIEVHISGVMLLLRIGLLEDFTARKPLIKIRYHVEKGVKELREMYNEEEIWNLLQIRLDATWWDIQKKLNEVFRKKVKLRPLPQLRKWFELLDVRKIDDKSGFTALSPRL